MKIIALILGLAVLASGAAFDAEAAAKKTGRDAYTREQQKKFYEEALKRCRKAYGTQLHYVRVKYDKGGPRVWCYHY